MGFPKTGHRGWVEELFREGRKVKTASLGKGNGPAKADERSGGGWGLTFSQADLGQPGREAFWDNNPREMRGREGISPFRSSCRDHASCLTRCACADAAHDASSVHRAVYSEGLTPRLTNA